MSSKSVAIQTYVCEWHAPETFECLALAILKRFSPFIVNSEQPEIQQKVEYRLVIEADKFLQIDVQARRVRIKSSVGVFNGLKNNQLHCYELGEWMCAKRGDVLCISASFI